ncbi:hypothetical protein M758_9G169900 [Ceratodon purpureus]|nr:hypothetical protein M758_9G169900 [Ceratodon purpureus]
MFKIVFLKFQYNNSNSSDPMANPMANLRIRSAFNFAHTDSGEFAQASGFFGVLGLQVSAFFGLSNWSFFRILGLPNSGFVRVLGLQDSDFSDVLGLDFCGGGDGHPELAGVTKLGVADIGLEHSLLLLGGGVGFRSRVISKWARTDYIFGSRLRNR